MKFNLISVAGFVVATGITVVSTAAFAKLPDAPQADASLNQRHMVSAAPLLWPQNVSPEREAKVTLRYTIEPDGHVDHVEVVGGANSPFAEAAANAVAGRAYAPTASATTGVETVAKFHAAP